jgi:ATP:ADP antiporter, AAA family
VTGTEAAGPLRLLQRVVPVRSSEVPALLWGFAQMFFLLAGNYVFRPIRDSLGSERGSEHLRWLYLGTLAATLVTSTAWSAIVARYPAKKFIGIAYEFFAASFVVIWALLTFAPDSTRVLAFGYFFFVWYSAYNIFIVSAFWSRCADLFTEEQGRRLFPYMVAGGSLGAIAGSGATAALAERMDTFNLLLIPVGLLQLALFCSRRLATAAVAARPAPEDAAAVAGAPVRGTLASGIEGALRSPLVVMIGLYVLFATFCGTCLYNINSDLARATYANRDART